MIVECAWCGSSLGHKEGLGVEGVTSGICDGCFAELERLTPSRKAPDQPEPESEDPRSAPRTSSSGDR